MSNLKKVRLPNNVNCINRITVTNNLTWIRQIGFFTVLVMALLFTGCDSSVVDNGNSLSSADFEEMQRSNHTGDLAPVCEAALLDVAIVLDVSGSINSSELQSIKNGAKALVAELGDTDQGTLVSFSTTAQRLVNLTPVDAAGQQSLEGAINGLTAGGGTNIQGGIIYGAEELTGDESLFSFVTTTPSGLDRDAATKIMVVLSDGQTFYYYDSNGILRSGSTNARQAALSAANLIKTEDPNGPGIRVFTIAVGIGADVPTMQNIASPGDYKGTDFNNLVTIFSDIAEDICPTPVAVDIKPEGEPNSINPNNKGVIPVAVLGSENFDVTTINPVTVLFGSLSLIQNEDGASLAHGDGHIEDVNGDGIPDFLGHFPTQDTGLVSGDLNGWLIGKTNDGESIAGFDAVKIVGGGKP
ncbi:VWA domain-containing protein [Rhodohalobacter sulfatireducens]|uniref:VWA domain-containing protein n=1 Tax=Rhodohalobacter sulfatireducens TaxID=2911366 RepID=A0ABS9KE11_9BACT|nr:vWA domain-containing protein [Rhodohalobacter sulfatireducens]MCG2589070.1 VWA domain-containing protein [Rhodohalobacter sulfatireducens]